MSETWTNIYHESAAWFGIERRSPKDSERDRCAEQFLRVEHRYNDHWFRPPVGMQAKPCAHLWVFNPLAGSTRCWKCDLELCDASEGA
jgi:hypothetical protein